MTLEIKQEIWRGCVLLIVSLGLLLGITSCSRPGASAKPADVDYYTCPMHPSVKKQNPTDKCPICGMALTPVMKKGGNAAAPGSAEHAAAGRSAETEPAEREFTVPMKRQQLIGVTYTAVEKKPFKVAIRAVALVAANKERHWDYVSRVDGYVKQLFVFSRGELVEKDQPLLTIYSPDLLTTENEFVDLLRSRDLARENAQSAVLESTERLIRSAKQRLRQWNINDQQIAELEKTRAPQEYLTLYSPFRGVAQDIGVDQGRRVSMGDHLIDIADLSVVWVWADFYQEEVSLLEKGLAVTITTRASGSERLQGKIALVDPFLNDAKRTARVRIDVENAGLKLRPEMYVDVELTKEMGEGLAVPAGAVMPTGKRDVVFIDKGEGKLEPRVVELGRRYGDDYEVKSGLAEGEKVVSSANFLIDAEAKVQGALKAW